MADELKPCPFCGEAPQERDADWGGTLFGCYNVACAAQPNVIQDTRKEAIAAWNQRTEARNG